jgi:hypothetical protein
LNKGEEIMQRHRAFGQISLIVFVLLSACGNSPDVTVNELSTNVISHDDIVRINNCGGKADSEQTQSRSFATTFEGGVGLSAGYKSIAEGSISAKYSQYRSITKSQRLVAPPGTNMEFVIRWSEDVRAGNVTVDGSSGNYEVRIPVSVEQISSQDLGCGNSSSSGATSDNETASTAFITLPRPPDYEWDVWSNASSIQVQGGCARLWRDLTYKGGPRDYLEVCNDKINVGNSSDWNDQIKDIEVVCSSGKIVVTLWEDANFLGKMWQHSFCQ